MKKIFYLAITAICIGIAAISCTKKDKTNDEAVIEDLGGDIYTINGYRFVDLGLPSGLLWAECNVGASSSTDEGSYFAWGETAVKASYTEDTYKYGKKGEYTKYCENDGKQILEAADDAATVALKAPCRTPLKAEFDELLNKENTTGEWTTKAVNGKEVNGIEIKSKKNNNSIFLPAYKYSGKNGDYWTAEIRKGDPYIDYDLASSYSFSEASGTNAAGSQYRYEGNSVRPVATISK